MTNGDYIRQKMSDEYIAQEFCGIASPFSGDCDSCPLYSNPKCECYEERLKWLKAEYVGDEKEKTLSELQEIRDILSDLVKRIEKMEEKNGDL